MIISPQSAYDSGKITNIADLSKQIGSDGIDLTLHSIRCVDPRHHGAAVLSEDKKKTLHRDHLKIDPVNLLSLYGIERGYVLQPGTYDLTFNEGCNLRNGVAGLILL